MISKERFSDEANEVEIKAHIRELRSLFHEVEGKHLTISEEPGFKATLKSINEMLADASYRFDEGKKSYALWRLKTATNYCVSCHTRHEVPIQFSDDSTKLAELSTIERGKFFLATRQFTRAKEAFKEAAMDPNGDAARMEALRNWLLVYTRVQPDPDLALTELTRMLAKVPVRSFDQEEVGSWIVSLRRWKSENRSVKIPDLVRAENLIRQALGGADPLTPRSGTVELLRATGILHQLLEGQADLSKADRGHALYLLGLAYSELPFFFITELPEMFLERSVREYPNTDTARKAFQRYRDVVTMTFTGSGGTRIPDEVLLKLKELHDLAFGTPKLSGQI
jgi:hypothetical protein